MLDETLARHRSACQEGLSCCSRKPQPAQRALTISSRFRLKTRTQSSTLPPRRSAMATLKRSRICGSLSSRKRPARNARPASPIRGLSRLPVSDLERSPTQGVPSRQMRAPDQDDRQHEQVWRVTEPPSSDAGLPPPGRFVRRAAVAHADWRPRDRAAKRSYRPTPTLRAARAHLRRGRAAKTRGRGRRRWLATTNGATRRRRRSAGRGLAPPSARRQAGPGASRSAAPRPTPQSARSVAGARRSAGTPARPPRTRGASRPPTPLGSRGEASPRIPTPRRGRQLWPLVQGAAPPPPATPHAGPAARGYSTRFTCGRGTSTASRSRKAVGVKATCVVPSAYG